MGSPYLTPSSLSEDGDTKLEEKKTASAAFFPSFEMLNLSKFPNLSGWWKKIEQQNHHLLVSSFPRTVYLYINGCPKLTSFPL